LHIYRIPYYAKKKTVQVVILLNLLRNGLKQDKTRLNHVELANEIRMYSSQFHGQTGKKKKSHHNNGLD
jgi:hypothetical protein